MVLRAVGNLPDEFVVGNNVSLLWLVPDNGDGSWSMYGWSNTNLKLVSNYLDGLTGTELVLSDTGLDIFTGESGPLTAPKSMPFGIADDDLLEPIMAATQDPAIAGALISAGAAGAMSLTQATNMQPIDECIALNSDGTFSQLDMELAYQARIIQETMSVWLSDEILDSIDATGYGQDVESWCFCIPSTHTVWGAWGAWSCTNPNAFWDGPTRPCLCLGCTHTRTGTRVRVHFNCSTTILGAATQKQGPTETSIPANANGTCPQCP